MSWEIRSAAWQLRRMDLTTESRGFRDRLRKRIKNMIFCKKEIPNSWLSIECSLKQSSSWRMKHRKQRNLHHNVKLSNLRLTRRFLSIIKISLFGRRSIPNFPRMDHRILILTHQRRERTHNWAWFRRNKARTRTAEISHQPRRESAMGAAAPVAQIENLHDKRKARKLQDKTRHSLDVRQLRSRAYWSMAT